jgi:hypothetical protein
MPDSAAPPCVTAALMQPYVFLSVATVAPEYYGSGFPPLPKHHLVSASVCKLAPPNEGAAPIRLLASFAIDDMARERELLAWINRFLVLAAVKENDDPTSSLVTFYGSTFGLPVILYRSLKHGTPLFLQERRLDIADLLEMQNPAVRATSISDTAELIGLPKRFNVDVAARFHEKNLADLHGVVAVDMLIQVLTFLRLLLVGAPTYHSPEVCMTVTQYRKLSRGVMDYFYAMYSKEKDPKYELVRDYLKQVDLRSFLLANV